MTLLLLLLGAMLALFVWFYCIINRPPSGCCLVVYIEDGDPAAELKLRRAYAIGLPLVVLDNGLTGTTKAVCERYCCQYGCAMLPPSQLAAYLNAGG